MGETSWLTGTSINGNAHIDDVLDASEERVEVAVGHFEGHVANEEGFGRWVERFLWTFCTTKAGALAVQLAGRICGVLDGEAAAFEELLIQGLDGFSGGGDGFEVDVSKSAE